LSDTRPLPVGWSREWRGSTYGSGQQADFATMAKWGGKDLPEQP